jgi:hypothetical protein
MKSLLAIFLFSAILASQSLFSQVGDISTDRPDQSESPYLMDKGYFQVELGGAIEKTGEYVWSVTGDVVTFHTHSYPSALFRYGLSKNVELRASIEYLQLKSKAKFEGEIQTETGFSPLTLGTKVKLFSEKGSMPETALLLNVSIPFKENSPFQSDYIGTEFRFAMTNNLSKRFTLSYNIGGEFGAGSQGATGIYTVALGAGLIKKLSAFVELYGFMPQKTSPDHRFDAGLTYLIMKNIQADASFGLGISEKSPDYFVGLGVSVRLPK